MEEKQLNLDMGNITVSVKLEDDGILVDVLRNANLIGFARNPEVIESAKKTYSELGLEVKEIEENE